MWKSVRGGHLEGTAGLKTELWESPGEKHATGKHPLRWVVLGLPILMERSAKLHFQNRFLCQHGAPVGPYL